MLNKLLQGQSLTSEETIEGFHDAMNDPIRMGAFLALLSAKGESVDELVGLVRALRAQMKTLSVGPILDIVGTGGDREGTVNISTGSALLAAQCGASVFKHGNRAVSSKCGSADVLEAMGFDIHSPVQKNGFGFCFAPDFHPAMKAVRPVRNALKIPTAFNLIGPLLNPAGIDHLQIGVYKPEFVPILAQVLFKLGTQRSLVFCGHGIDELSCIGPTEALLVTEEGIQPFAIDPAKLGFDRCTLDDLRGGDAVTNAQLLKNPTRPIRDTLVLNAGVGLFLYGKTKTIQEGVALAKRKSFEIEGVIAEIKRASPSKGKIGEIPDVAERAQFYEAAGATALSVLTSDRFEGNLEDLRVAREAVSIPVLRKDFLTTKEHLLETKADIVLLIVSYLGERTQEMLEEAHRLGFAAIVEIHNQEELQIALKAGAEIIGVNQRNLKDFSMHPEVYDLVDQIPETATAIAESGVKNLSDAKRLYEMGYDAILVGEALTRTPELCEELCSLKSVV